MTLGFKGKKITFQVIQFGAQRSDVVEFFERNLRAVEHLMLKNWDVAYETLPYPPASGEYAVYSRTNLFNYIENAWEKVSAAVKINI
jgi:mucolipin 3/mucolipin